jgi:hypothetical protein
MPLPVALSFASCLVMGKHSCTALCHTRMYQSGGIVVGTFNLLKFYKRITGGELKRQRDYFWTKKGSLFIPWQQHEFFD